MIAPGIYDPRYGFPDAVAETGGGPFAAGKGALVTDGASAFFQVGRVVAPPVPEDVARVLRPLMRRPKDALAVSFFDLSVWLSENFATCDKCVKSITVCTRCTTQCGIIRDVMVYGWHVRRQLGLIEHRPVRVHLAATRDERGQPVLQVACDQWTYIRVGVIGQVSGEVPRFPLAQQ